MIEVTFQAVSKVIVAVLVGAFCCGSIPNSTTTMRDLSFLISNVLLPALTVTNTASAVNLDMLIRCSILLFFGVLVALLGIGGAIAMSHMLFGVRKTSTGIPLELSKDVWLDLRFDEAPPTRRDASSDDSSKKKKKRSSDKKRGAPYVAVVLNNRMREMGIAGREVVPEIEIPAAEVEEFPFYYWGAWVGCSIQNTVTLPLSLLHNLCESVTWLNFEEGTAYIFVFSITASLYIWAFGPLYVEWAQKETAKRRLIREIVTIHKMMMTRVDAVTQTDISYTVSHDVLRDGALRDGISQPPVTRPVREDVASTIGHQPNALAAEGDGGSGEEDGEDACATPIPRAAAETAVPMGSTSQTSRSTSPPPEMASEYVEEGEQTEYQPWSPNTARHFSFPEFGGVQQIPYDWEAAGFVRVKYADQLKNVGGPSALAKVATSVKRIGMQLVKNLPFMSIVVGMIIGIIPPLRALFFNGGPLEMIKDAVTLVGQGNIPAALLLLGANLVGSGSMAVTGSEAVRLRDSEQNTDFPLVPASDRELAEDGGEYAKWYELHHEQMEFDVHASFSLQTILRQQANERFAAERAATVRAKEEAGRKGGAEATEGQRRLKALTTLPTRKTTDEILADAAAGNGLSASARDDAEVGSAAEEGCMAGVHRALSLAGVKKRFVWGVIAQRLLIAPALGFLLLIALIKAMPFLFGGKGHMDKTILIVLFMELAAPTAINSALLFNQRDYMTYPWAKMLFFQYILCTVTLVMWATVGLEYVARYVD